VERFDWCVDFRNLNQLFLKNNYSIPNLEHLLQRVIGARMMSILDGFFRYNQVLIKKEDQLNTAFTTSWGTFMYLRMSFGLMNVGSTFQRAMDFSFRDLIGKIIEIYHNDLTVVSKERNTLVLHLRKIFEQCRKYGISLNPKKSIFGIDKGKSSLKMVFLLIRKGLNLLRKSLPQPVRSIYNHSLARFVEHALILRGGDELV
jgi:hypothetical protein